MNRFFVKRLYAGALVAIVFLGTFLLAPEVRAYSVAVFPLEDVSQGANGVNLPLTRFLSQKIEERGEEVVPLDKMIAYMARHRIRWLGYLDTKNVLQMRQELGADIVLLGTVSQLQEDPYDAIGLILTAVETQSAQTIWTTSGAVSRRDICNVLGLAEPEGVEGLQKMLTDQLLQTWSSGLYSVKESSRPVVKSSQIGPRYVKPGDEVRCSVKLYGPGHSRRNLASLMEIDQTVRYSSSTVGSNGEESGDDWQQVQLMVGNDDYLTMEKKSWDLYEATWPAPERDAVMPISLVLTDWDGERQVYFLGNYRVDNQAPQLSLKLNAEEIGGKKVFRDNLVIIPIWQDPEPASRWLFSVINEEGEVMVSGEREGNLPRQFYWKGQRPDGYKAADGEYDIVVKVWDLAENLTKVVRKVSLKATPPILQINAERQEEQLLFQLGYESDIPVDFWTCRFYLFDGETVLEKQGYSLPVELTLPRYPEQALQAVVTVQDVLGNRAEKKIKNVEALAPEGEEADEAREQEWLEEF